MEPETQQFINNIDEWIKQVRCEFSDMKEQVSTIAESSDFVEEHQGNIQHNYELIKEMMNEIRSLRTEVKTLKVMKFVEVNGKPKIME